MSNILVNQLTGNTTDTTIDVFAGHAADSTTRTNLEQGLAKAWAKWDASSTVTLDDSLNTTSISDNGTGDFEQNLTNSMNNADYSVTATIKYYHASKDATVSTTSMFPIFCYYVSSTGGGRTAYDTSYISTHALGDLA